MADRAQIVSVCDRYVQFVSDQDTDAILDAAARALVRRITGRS